MQSVCMKLQYMVAISLSVCTVCRDFIDKYYVELKQQNPKFPFLVRECSGVEPKLYGRYGEYLHIVTHSTGTR